MPNAPLDLRARAHQAMVDAGFHPEFPPEVCREVQTVKTAPANAGKPDVRDLRSLLWSSIDNDTSRDLDQVEYAEKRADATVRLLVGIADVDSAVPKASATDLH